MRIDVVPKTYLNWNPCLHRMIKVSLDMCLLLFLSAFFTTIFFIYAFLSHIRLPTQSVAVCVCVYYPLVFFVEPQSHLCSILRLTHTHIIAVYILHQITDEARVLLLNCRLMVSLFFFAVVNLLSLPILILWMLGIVFLPSSFDLLLLNYLFSVSFIRLSCFYVSFSFLVNIFIFQSHSISHSTALCFVTLKSISKIIHLDIVIVFFRGSWFVYHYKPCVRVCVCECLCEEGIVIFNFNTFFVFDYCRL